MTFRLKTLLRVRKNEEDKELKQFGMVNAHLVNQREQLDFMKNLEQKNSQNLDIQREGNPDPNLLWLYDNFFGGVRIQKQRSDQIISEVEEKKQGTLFDYMNKNTTQPEASAAGRKKSLYKGQESTRGKISTRGGTFQ